MKTYSQTLTFRRQVTIEAENAIEANAKLDLLIAEVEWAGDVGNDGFYHYFEDPEWKRNGGQR